MKILICGANGQLGRDSAEVLAPNHQVVITDVEELDITDREKVNTYLRRLCPEIIVNCAAYTRVDACEAQEALAARINRDGPDNLAQSAQKCGARLIHISTDYVFDGTKPLPGVYTENDPPHPISAYGRTKLAGEEAVRRATDRFVILRTAWLYGIGGPNFLKTILKRAVGDPRRQIRVVNDQFGSPTWSYRLALQIGMLIESGGTGLYHATAEGSCSWYELADRFLREMNVPHRVVPCPTEAYQTAARRPKNSILENSRLKAAGIHCMADWQEDVARYAARYHDRLLQEATEEMP